MRFAFPLLFSLVSGLIFSPSALLAKDIRASSKVVSVTVFPSGAQVTREIRAEFENGSHKLIVDDLPADLKPQTLRIRGEGGATLVIGSIDQKIITLPLDGSLDKSERQQLQVELARLQDQRSLVVAGIEAAELKKKLLNEMIYIPSRQGRRENAEFDRDELEHYSGLYGLMGRKYIEAATEIINARIKTRKLDQEISNIKKRLAEKPQNRKKNTQLSVNVRGTSANAVRFLVSYQIANASWWPVYDARLTSSKTGKASKLQLVRRAVITQRTSEDWRDVSLTLSTTNPSGRTQAPQLRPILVDFQREIPPVADAASERRRADYSIRAERSMKRALKPQLGALAPAPVRQQRARVNSGRYQMVFVVDGLVSVERNGEQKKVLLDEMNLETDVGLIAAPKLSPKAFVHAVFKNKLENPIVGGVVSLFRDGVYVGQTRLKLIEPGQSTKLGFGVDPKVKVKWAKLDRVKGETGLITTSNSDVRRYKITVNNGHDRAVALTVFDHMPYSEKENITVTLLATSAKPSRQNVEDKRGVLAWEKKLAGNSGATIEFGYQIIWPKDKKIRIQRR